VLGRASTSTISFVDARKAVFNPTLGRAVRDSGFLRPIYSEALRAHRKPTVVAPLSRWALSKP
jgi:hypothetical protein